VSTPIQLNVTRRRAADAEKRIAAHLDQSSDLPEPLAMAAKKIHRKKALIMELRERNKDLAQANAQLSVELQSAVLISRQLADQNDTIQRQQRPPPYRVVQKAIEDMNQNLENKSEAVQDLTLALALTTADRDEVSTCYQQSNKYIDLLEGQLQVTHISL
jgi:chromosome segregation ATPase